MTVLTEMVEGTGFGVKGVLRLLLLSLVGSGRSDTGGPRCFLSDDRSPIVYHREYLSFRDFSLFCRTITTVKSVS